MLASQRILFTVLFCICYFLAKATDSLNIKYLGISQGLSNSSVRCIFQDRDGFIWLGTYDGLNRYDGYNFKTFRNVIGDTGSLPHNYINAIGEDFHHNLVVGTGQGVSIYNSLTQRFSTGQYIPAGSKSSERITYNVNTIRTDAKGNLYMTTNGGGLLVKPDGSNIFYQIACGKDENGNCSNDVHSLVIDGQQRIWLMITGAGLYQYLPTTQTLKLINSQQKVVRCMEADNAGNLWIGTYDGLLYKYNVAQNSFAQPFNNLINHITSKSIFSLAFDRRKKELWIGTEGDGINILNEASGTMNYILPGEGKNKLSSETVYTIYEDKEHRKWIGTHKGGIDIIEPQANPFQTISHNPLTNNSLVGNFIASFYEDNTRNLWIGTDGGGISFWNRSENKFNNYTHNEGNSRSLSNNSVPSIVEDYLGVVWVATFGGGINQFNRTDGTFKHYPCINTETGNENNYVWKLLEDREHNLWATTYSNGRLYRLNRQTDRFEVFNQDLVDFFCLAEDHTGTLWAGTAYGLCNIDKKSSVYTHFKIDKPVRAIYEDKKGRLWIGSEGQGLLRFDQQANKIAEEYNTTNGLCNNSVLNILEDDKGNLWLSTFHGLSRFNAATKTFKNFYGEDGLQSNQFEYNAALRLRSGEMVFGGINGFNLFDPARLPSRNYNPPVLLTDLRINNIPVAEGSPYITNVQDDRVAAVKIPFSEALLSFNFAALEYSAPGKITYAYYLEGWDKGWNYTNSTRSANYTKLGDGTYTLRIKATNAEGVWNPKEVRLKVVVLPPWYRSWWAYLLYVLIIAGFIYLYNAYRVRKAHLEYEVKLARLRSEKDKELAQLEIQKEKELAEKKLTFFTDVSHEFRTPLTLIINPLKDYLESDKPQDKKELNVVYRNARRLLTLVDQLLQFRKAGADTDQLRLVKLNLCTLCKEVWASFEKAALLKQMNYQFICHAENEEIYADREKLEVILYNLLSNALKFTPEGGEIVMSVAEKENTIEVKLTDNGRGIPSEVGNKLFDRFYRVQENGVSAKPGFGIGLYLVKHFVEKHKGSISYESSSGAGTTFCLSFQKGGSHFSGMPVYEDVIESTMLPDEFTPENANAIEPEKAGLGELLSGQKTILIVEDNSQIREYVSSVFSESFTVYQAASGNEGIEAAKKYLPDIIISDIMMENGNGIELCSTIKNDPSLGHIPIILLTAVSDNEIRLKGTESGADDYITKPFEKDLLVARVNALLKSRTKLQQYFFDEVTLKKHDFKISAEYKEFLDNCIAIIERHLEDDDFNIKKLSLEIGMSHSALYRKVKSVSGQSIAGFIRFIRLRKAAELMINTNRNVNEIAFQVGMNDIKYFRKQFNALFEMNPSEYIKKYRPAFTPVFTKQRGG